MSLSSFFSHSEMVSLISLPYEYTVKCENSFISYNSV